MSDIKPQWARDHHGETEVYTKADLDAARKDMRERCAKVCMELDEKYGWGAANMCAEAIEQLKD